MTSDGQSATGKPLPLPKSGLVLQLELAAGQKLDSSKLELQAVGKDDSLTATITTAQGAMQGMSWKAPVTVNWLTADWGVDRTLTAIQVQLVENTNPGTARLKVFTAGAWIPLYPIDIIATGTEQRFSPVLASKVMVELVIAGEHPGVWLPNPAQMTGVTLKATCQPCDLSLAIADQPPFFRHAGPLPTTAAVQVTGLTQAVNAYLDAPKAVLPVPLRLQAAVPGELKLSFDAVAVTVIRQLDLEIPLEGGEAVGQVTVGTKATLKAISFVVEFKPRQEALLLFPSSTTTKRLQLCDSNHSVAQGFQLELQEKVVTGLDLYLYPRSAKVEATLNLHPDLNGRPTPSPYGQAVIPIHWQAEADDSREERWVSCQLPQPLWIKDKAWWAVLNVSAGSILWAMGDNLPTGVGKDGCLYQIAGGAWLPRRLPSAGSAWAYTRVRISKPGPKSLESIILRRGEANCVMDAEGRVQLDLDTLNTLDQKPIIDPLLKIAVTAESAGTVSLRDIRILSAG